MHSHKNLLHIVSVLKKRVPKTERFNVFSVLRSDSDEVRLHSRFIGALIDPDYHHLGANILALFLKQLDVDDFPVDGAKVHIEFSGIDIFIAGKNGKAVIVENKIYAGDQDKQLKRYYDTVKARGFKEIYVRYLTLDGHDPSKESLCNLGKDLSYPYYLSVSYFGHIRSWLEEAACASVWNVNVREGIVQYKAVIDKLIGADQGAEYMSELQHLLLSGENMKAAKDIRQAYIEGLIALQVELWADMRMEFERLYPEMYKHLSANSVSNQQTTLEKVKDFYLKRSKYFGLFFHVPGYSEKLTVGIELQHRFYVGVACNRQFGIEEREKAKKILNDAGITGNQTEWWPLWYWHDCGLPVNFMEPDDDFLDVLISKERRINFISSYVREVGNMWNLLCEGKTDA